MKQEPQKYEEWLTTIANTRFVFNTMEELEEMLGNYAIHNNGIRRCFPTGQKLRAAYRDLKVEVELIPSLIFNYPFFLLSSTLQFSFAMLCTTNFSRF